MTGFVRNPARRGNAERDALVIQWLDLVPWAIYKKLPSLRRWAKRLGGYRDATQYGNLALIRAAEIWDETRGQQFSSYAVRCIRWRIFAEGEKVKNSKDLLDSDMRIELDKHWSIVDMCPISPRDYLAQEMLDKAVNRLPTRHRQALCLRWGLCGNQVHSLSETAKIMDVCKERVRQIELKALWMLRKRGNGLAEIEGVHECKLCQSWEEYIITCDLCKKEGCSRCVTQSLIPRLSGMVLCKRCIREQTMSNQTGY